MRVCAVWDSEYPWDVRVAKICRSLVRAGHEVHLVCRNRRREPRREVHDGISIHRLPAFPSPLNATFSFPAFLNPLWLHAVARVVREEQCDLVLVRDLPLALTGLLVGKASRRPVVLDFAENYPAMLGDFWPQNRRKPFNWIVRNPRMARAVERLAVALADHILVVVEEAAERLRALGVDDRKLSIVMNTPLPEWFRDAKSDSTRAEEGNPHFDILYLGFLDPARGVDIALRALPAVVRQIPRARLVVVGTGNHEVALRALAHQLGVADRVLFNGWVPRELTTGWIAASSVGIVPHHATESWMTTIPNKLFDYMVFGKPVLVSDARPVRRIVEAERCGLVFRDRDVTDFTEQLIQLAGPALRRALGSNGRQAVLERYNWEADEKTLLAGLEETLKGH